MRRLLTIGIVAAALAIILPSAAPTVPATAMMPAQINQLVPSFRKPTCVRSPLNAKNRGSRNMELKFSRPTVRFSRNASFCGMMAPARNAPKSA